MRKVFQSIAFRLSMPIPLFFLLCMGIAWVTIPRILENSTIAFATSSATNVANQIKKIRGYYTENVIMDVESASDISVGIEHKDDPNMIPLPATFVHDISRLFVDQDISLLLYSAFPFPDRVNRQVDGFMQEAWIYLNENPDGTFTRQEVEKGVTFLRVAVADRMVAQTCVSCHNSHPDSPKTDWQLGDVRGVLEVRGNIQAPLASSLELTRNILIGVALAGLGLLLIVWSTTRTIIRPVTKICASMNALAAGNMDSEVPTANRSDELGQIGKALVSLQDDLKRAHDATSARTEQMGALLNALPDNYFRLDKNGTILDYRIHPGLTISDDPAAHLGHTVFETLPPGPSALLKENMKKQRAKQKIVSWEYNLEFEGKLRYREARLCPIAGSDETVLVVRDISKRHQAVRQSALVEARLERIVTSLPGAVLSRRVSEDEGSVAIYVSSKSEEIWGYTPEEVYATKGVLEATVDPDDMGKLIQLLSDAVKNGETYSHRYQVTTRSGERKWLETHTNGTLQKDGSILTDGFVTDVTSDVRAQEHMRAQQEVAARAQKLDSIGQLTGGVAHDFNNLLAAIMFSLELLRDDEADEQHLTLINNSLTAAQRGADLTRSMLAFASQASLDPSLIDLNKLVNEIHNWAGRTLPSSITVKTSLSENLWPIMADVSSTESALLNLLVNARDAMPEGGDLTIETMNVRFDEGYLDARQKKMAPGQYVMLAVSDTGHGIPAESLERIFEPFFTTKAPDKGTGHGLSMIFGFMQQSGGTVQVYSEPGVGTTFKLYFKARNDEVDDRVAMPVNVESLQGNGQKILVVEDDENVLSILIKILKKSGYVVTTARSGDEALALFEANSTFDLLLTDIMMPGHLKGTALSRAIREKVGDFPVIFMSGYASEATVQGNGLRADDIRLMKPIMRADLLAAIKKSLNS